MSELKLLSGRLEIRLKMKSDWRIGAGVGRPGEVDSLARRDADEMPFVPAKTLTGIWRDACETVACGLDNGAENGKWSQLLKYLFGDQTELNDDNRRRTAPRPARISVRAARLPKTLRKAIKAKPYLKDAVTFVKPGIGIHPRTGRTRTDFLRFEEMARAEAEMTATAELSLPNDIDDETQKAATALLVAGACFVERIGGKRRRGAGRCEMTLNGFDKEQTDPWLDWIETHLDPALDLKQEAGPGDKKFEKLASGEWVSLPLRITTQTPVIVPERTVGNLVKTLDFIPGTYLLPFITERLGGKGVDIRSAIAHGDLIVTNATPEVGGQPGRPTPLNLYHRKLDGGLSKGCGVLNRLEEFEENEEGTQLKPHRGGYVGASGGALPEYVKTEISVETHNVVDDKSQRPTSDVGGVFSYQSINQGEELRAELRLRKSLVEELDAVGDDWRKKLESESYRIGRARKDDYGVVKIATDIPRSEERKSENEIQKMLRVWLLSDLLLRDERLRPTASVSRLAEELGAALGVTLTLRRSETLNCEDKSPRKMDFAARSRRIDSWNTAWGLPRPSLAGLAAGSCFVFEAQNPQCDAATFSAKLKEVEAGGLGERRAEGYGQISFNDPLLSGRLLGVKGAAKSSDKRRPDFAPVSDDDLYARLIETEGWRREIRRRALKKVSAKAGREEVLGVKLDQNQSKPRMSQLGALRSVVERLRDYQDASKVIEWISHLKKSRNREGEWPKGSLEVIEKLVTDREHIWELLKNDDLKWAEFTITQDGEIALKNKLWAESVRALVDACVRAQKRDLEKLRQGVARG